METLVVILMAANIIFAIVLLYSYFKYGKDTEDFETNTNTIIDAVGQLRPIIESVSGNQVTLGAIVQEQNTRLDVLETVQGVHSEALNIKLLQAILDK